MLSLDSIADKPLNSDCTKTLFIEKDEVFLLLNELAGTQNGLTDEKRDQNAEKIKIILEKYQEQSNLLDPHLESIMSVIMERVKYIILDKIGISSESSSSKMSFPYQMYSTPQLHALLGCVYQLCRVRGYKFIIRFMPHEASDLEPALCALQNQDQCAASTWQSRYVLLLWLSMLCLIPFNISTVDSGNGGVDSIMNIAMQHISDAPATRDAAAILISALLSRSDISASHLESFISFAITSLEAVSSSPGEGGDFITAAFTVHGTLKALSGLFKKGDRDSLIPIACRLIQPLLGLTNHASSQMLLRKMAIKLIQRIGLTFLPPRVVNWRYQRGQRSLMANLTMPQGSNSNPEKESNDADDDSDDEFDVPDEIEIIIEQMLCGLRDRDTVVRWSAAKGIGRITSRLPKALANEVVTSLFDLFSDAESDAGWHGGCLALAELARRGLLLPARLPLAIPVVTRAMAYDVRKGNTGVGSHVRDAACYVCWAFARAYSPQALRPYMPELCKCMLATALFDREITVRRASAAAFQENVGRQGNENVAHGIEILTTADYFSLGSRVAAYKTIAPYVAQFSDYQDYLVDIVRQSRLRHWDAHIRLLSSQCLGTLACLNIKRTTDVIIPDLLVAIGSSDFLVCHGACIGLAEVIMALSNFDESQTLSSHLASKIVESVPSFEKVNRFKGQGCNTLKIAACRLMECCALSFNLTPLQALKFLDKTDECLRESMEEVQFAAARCITALLKYVEFNDVLFERTVTHHLDSLLSNATPPVIARGHALALGCLPRALAARDKTTILAILRGLSMSCEPSNKIFSIGDVETRKNAINALADMTNTIGFSNETMMNVEASEVVFSALLRAVNDYGTDKRGDVGSWCRICAMQALDRIAHEALLSSRGIPSSVTETDNFNSDNMLLVPTIQERLQFMNITFVDGMVKMPLYVREKNNGIRDIFFTPKLCAEIVCALLKQLSEKLDSVRDQAGQVLQQFLTRVPQIPYVPYRKELEEALEIHKSELNFANAAETFPKVVKILSIPEYQKAVMSGLAISVGGLTESVVKHSSAALLTWSRASASVMPSALSNIGLILIDLISSGKEESIADGSLDVDRISLPALRTLDLLIANDAFKCIPRRSTLGEKLIKSANLSLRGSKSVPKICAVGGVCIGLLGWSDGVGTTALRVVLVLLGHRFPNVRKQVAELLYVRFLAWDGVIEEKSDESKRIEISSDVLDECIDLLSDSNWEGSLEFARQCRNNLAELFNVSLPTDSKNRTESSTVKKEENDGYESLVRDAGY